MATQAKEKREKAKILRWWGVLGESSRVLRWLVAIVLAVAGAAFSFTQLGFVSVPTLDGDSGYVVVLLQLVALGALLLGTLPGAALGMAIGAILLVHAKVMPLDHYELAFITPVSSIVMFGLCGLMLGVLFAFVLRNNPGRVKRVIYITIVCIVASILYNVGFVTCAIGSLFDRILVNIGPEADVSVVTQMALATVAQLGDMNVQTWLTALLMAILCCLGDFLARRVQARRGALGLRAVFGAWLGVVVALAFMAISAISFASATLDGLVDSRDAMQGEVDYIYDQLVVSNERISLLNSVMEQGELTVEKIDVDKIDELVSTLDDRSLISGYTKEQDGVVIVTIDDEIYAANDEHFKDGISLEDAFGPEVVSSIGESIETGELQRIVFNGVPLSEISMEAEELQKLDPFIAYLYARKVPDIRVDSTGENVGYSQTIIMIRSSDQVFSKRGGVMVWMTISSLVLLLVVFALVEQLLNRVVARPIDEENQALARITDGDLNVRVEAGGTREFESLSNDINATVDALKGWIAEAESRMDAELATARAIQESALPSTFPPFPDIVKFDIYASMTAAKQVGGDFYDFFLVGDDCDAKSGKVAFIVADVSGKGVPAALFMMKAKALLRDYVSSGMELGEAVSEANRQLIDGNDEGMFVTAWVGVLDYGTGHVDYVNAGHNPPLLWNRANEWQWMRQKSGPVLGLFEMPYRTLETECKAGDTFLLYTDGVTEAFDVEANLYGEDRLMAVADEGFLLHPRELLEAVRNDVALYAQGAEQSDDITILVLEVGVPPEVTATLVTLARISELDRVNGFLHAELDRRLCPQRVQNQLDIAVEELFVNVCRYAYPDATPENPGNVRIQRTYNADPPSVTVDIIDEGIPYNPLAKLDAVTPGNIEDVPIGGLGILMAKRCTDEMRYERVDDCNVVTIVKKW